ncbi:MAG: hypothetical protein WA584_22470 [Pyrinomonadaceae bacterium]
MPDSSGDISDERKPEHGRKTDNYNRYVESGNFNEEKARQILSTKWQAQTEMEIIRLRSDAAILNLLTTEQKTQLAGLKEKRPQVPPGDGFRPDER